MVAMVVEKMSVEKMYKSMKKRASNKAVDEPLKPNAKSSSLEEEGPPESKFNKKKKNMAEGESFKPNANSTSAEEEGPPENRRSQKKKKPSSEGAEVNDSSKKKKKKPTSEGAKVNVSVVPEPVGMQIYWNLSNVDAAVREAASVALVRELVGAQKDYEDRGEITSIL
jgi:hypothetical protein